MSFSEDRKYAMLARVILYSGERGEEYAELIDWSIAHRFTELEGWVVASASYSGQGSVRPQPVIPVKSTVYYEKYLLLRKHSVPPPFIVDGFGIRVPYGDANVSIPAWHCNCPQETYVNVARCMRSIIHATRHVEAPSGAAYDQIFNISIPWLPETEDISIPDMCLDEGHRFVHGVVDIMLTHLSAIMLPGKGWLVPQVSACDCCNSS